MFHFILILILISISSILAASPDCSGFYSVENSCNMLILEVAQEWPKHKPMPSRQAAAGLAHTCMKALNCLEMLECPEKNSELSEKIKELAETCSGLLAFDSSFGDCLQTIRSNDKSEEYPCLKYWNNPKDAPSCDFFTADYDCAEMIMENKCGDGAVREMRKNLKFVKSNFGCDEQNNEFSLKLGVWK